MFLGQFLGEEMAWREYKEFKLTMIFEHIKETMAKSIVEDKRFDILGHLIKQCLECYILKYVPKYLVSFGNSSAIDKGEFYIGVSDYGEVLGVPISDVESVRTLINETIQGSLENVSDDTKNSILNEIEVEFIPVNYDENLYEDNLKIKLSHLKEKYHNYCCAEQLYVKEKTEWLEQIMFWRQQINLFANLPDMRQNIIKLIEKEPTLTVDDKEKLITRLNDSTPINYEFGEVPRRKLDIRDVTYWIVKYRDDNCEAISQIKPPRFELNKPEKPYRSILRDFRPLLPKVCDKIPVFLIKIIFPGQHKIHPWQWLSYTDGGKLKSPYRTVDIYDKPVCIES